MARKIIATWGMILVLLASAVDTVAAQSGTDTTETPTATPVTQPAPSTFYAHPIVQLLSAYFGREMGTGSTVDPTETPTVEGTPDPSETVTAEPSETVTTEPSETVTAEPSETPTEEPVGTTPDDLAQQIAQYHEDGLGFGVLVKLYAMAEAAAMSCPPQPVATPAADGSTDVTNPTDGTPEQPACTAVTVDELVKDFQSGTGMGVLFKEYGKPALLGVGHVRKAMQQQPTQPAQPTEEVTEAPTESETEIATDAADQSTMQTHGNSGKPVKEKTPKPKGNPHK